MQDRTRRKTGPKPKNPIERLRFEIDHRTGCWNWLGKISHHGYGRFMLTKGESMVNAHRAAYILLVGPVQDGLHVDHLCRNRACVNPAHLEPVTPRENLMRGIGPSATNARKTHCVHGHPYDEENTYRWRGQRRCRECNKVEPKPPRRFPHGTIPRYRRGCRCDQCRAMNATKAREFRARKKSEAGLADVPLTSWNALKTHCPAGHEYSEENTYWNPKPEGKWSRMCRTCGREHARKKRAEKRAGQ